LNFELIYRYCCYVLFSGHRKGHGIHSPFVFELVTKVFNDKEYHDAFTGIEDIRKELLRSDKIIKVKDLGAGSKITGSINRKIKDIVRYSSVKEKYGKLLFHLVSYFMPGIILELGTSLGISTLYMALANSNAKVLTIEGCPETAAVAKDNFDKAGAGNIELLEGEFDEVLADISRKDIRPDFVFIDGNHRKDATLRYFEHIIKNCGNDTVFVFDDIHWSSGMEEAWNKIKAHREVTVTIDIFFMGIIFLKKELSKEDFVIKY